MPSSANAFVEPFGLRTSYSGKQIHDMSVGVDVITARQRSQLEKAIFVVEKHASPKTEWYAHESVLDR